MNGHISYRTGLSLVFGTFFMNTVAPSMNLAGTSLVMATATRNGMQAGKGTTAALLMQLSIDSGFVIIMLTTFGVLTFTVGLQPGWLALGLVAVALVGGLVFVIAVGGLKPQLVLKVLRPFVKLADKILAKFKKPAIDESVERTIHNFSSAAAPHHEESAQDGAVVFVDDPFQHLRDELLRARRLRVRRAPPRSAHLRVCCGHAVRYDFLCAPASALWRRR